MVVAIFQWKNINVINTYFCLHCYFESSLFLLTFDNFCMHYMVFDHCLLNDSLSTIQSEPFVKYNKDKLSSNTYVRFWLIICNRIC